MVLVVVGRSRKNRMTGYVKAYPIESGIFGLVRFCSLGIEGWPTNEYVGYHASDCLYSEPH